MTLPLVSCLTPTYGRVPDGQWLVEEAVESFLRQDYPADRRELIVLSDHPAQELFCNAPGVSVINVPRRFQSLGEKYNAMVGLSTGQFLCPWEDDDISLPWRISTSIEMLSRYDASYYTPKKYWSWDDDRYSLNHSMGVGHNCGIYSRDAWITVHGYPPTSGDQDMVIDQRLIAAVKSRGAVEFGDEALPHRLWYYIMRWQTGSYHLSAAADHEKFYKELANVDAPSGVFKLRPMWRRDYTADVRMALESQ